jgi:hypothetical protein
MLCVLAIATLAGCDRLASMFKKDADGPKDEQERRRREFPLHIAGTISQHAGLLGGDALPVKGYGVVVGLGRNGSGEIPPRLSEYLTQYMLKNRVGLHSGGTGDLSPGRILRDPDTAVVEVRGFIPQAAMKDTRFDVVVTALAATGTRSLSGGVLMPTELHLDTGGNQLAGDRKVWAIAGGPLLVNPFIDITDSANAGKLREGMIVGGGKSARRRTINLQLYRPDYAQADLIQRRLNAQFPGVKRVANAKNSSLVELFIPPQVRGDHEHFLQLIRHLPMRTGPGIWEAHARELITEMQRPDVSHDGLALVLESHGRKAIPLISTLYDSSTDAAAFYAARTGIRLSDHNADDVIVKFALASGHPLQLKAIDVLGREETIIRSRWALAKLLHDDNDMVRVAAYESLDRRRSSEIVSFSVAGQFRLDIVPTDKTPMVYATRTKKPRIVIFGEALEVNRPVFFSTPDNLLTVNAEADSETLAVWRRLPVGDRVSETFRVSYDVPRLVRTLGDRPERDLQGNVKGLGLTYGQVIGAMYRLCKDGHIPARFVLEPTPGELKLIGRVIASEATR